MGVYEPTLMMQAGGALAAEYGYLVELGWAFFKACLTILICGVAAIGYFLTQVTKLERITAGLAGAFFIVPNTNLHLVAVALTAVLTISNWRAARRT
jgi:TRAP-type uncharacterized transport system fused permease subunit